MRCVAFRLNQSATSIFASENYRLAIGLSLLPIWAHSGRRPNGLLHKHMQMYVPICERATITGLCNQRRYLIYYPIFSLVHNGFATMRSASARCMAKAYVALLASSYRTNDLHTYIHICSTNIYPRHFNQALFPFMSWFFIFRNKCDLNLTSFEQGSYT